MARASLTWQSQRSSTGDFEKEWFTSGEAINLACQPNTDMRCEDLESPSDPIQAPISDIAMNRNWDTSDISNELQQEVITEQIQEYEEAWQLTTQEEQRADDQDQFDDLGNHLNFGLDAIEAMVESVLNFID